MIKKFNLIQSNRHPTLEDSTEHAGDARAMFDRVGFEVTITDRRAVLAITVPINKKYKYYGLLYGKRHYQNEYGRVMPFELNC